MTNAERGRRTGQHEQRTQQAVMFRGCELLAELEGLGYRVRVVTKLNRYSWLQTRRAKIAAAEGASEGSRP